MTAVVRRLGDEAWATLRDVRVAALTDAPEAFNSTAAEARTFDEAAWRARLGEQAWFIAERGGAVVGVASCGEHREDPGARVLRSMWVAPQERGRGTAASLLEAVVELARLEGARVLVCWALHAAPRARAFYRGHGFVEVESSVPHGDGPPMARYERAL